MWSNSKRPPVRPQTIPQLEVLESRNLLSSGAPTNFTDVQSAVNTLMTDVKDLVSDVVSAFVLGKGGSANIPGDVDRIQSDVQTATTAVANLPANPQHIGLDLTLFAIGDVLSTIGPAVPVVGGKVAKVGNTLFSFGVADLTNVVSHFFAEQLAPFVHSTGTGPINGKVIDEGGGGCAGKATVGGTVTVAPQPGGTVAVTFDLEQGKGICDDYSGEYTGSAVMTGGPISLVLSGPGTDIFVNNLLVKNSFSLSGVETHGSGDWSFESGNGPDIASGTFSF